MYLLEKDKITQNSIFFQGMEKPYCYTKERNFLTIPYGSIIWANRSGTKYEKDLIPGHESGPFVVVGRNEDSLLCFYGSGVERSSYLGLRAILLDHLKYRDILSKDTYIDTFDLTSIAKNDFIEFMGMLDSTDRKSLSKRIYINSRKGFYSSQFLENDSVFVNPGDVLFNGYKKYLVLDVSENNLDYTLLPINGVENQEKIDINGREYYYSFANAFQREKIDDMRLIDFISPFELEKILAKRRKYLDRLSTKDSIKRGSLVRHDEEIYYVYGENGDAYLAFKIYYHVIEDMPLFTVNGKNYHSDFKTTILFSRKDNSYFPFAQASEEEMDFIKKQKKSFMKSIKEAKTSKKKVYKLDTGVIVKEKMATEAEYFVVVGNQDDIVVLSLDDIADGRYKLLIMRPSEVKRSAFASTDMILEVLGNIREEARGIVSQERIYKLIKKYEKQGES